MTLDPAAKTAFRNAVASRARTQPGQPHGSPPARGRRGRPFDPRRLVLRSPVMALLFAGGFALMVTMIASLLTTIGNVTAGANTIQAALPEQPTAPLPEGIAAGGTGDEFSQALLLIQSIPKWAGQVNAAMGVGALAGAAALAIWCYIFWRKPTPPAPPAPPAA